MFILFYFIFCGKINYVLGCYRCSVLELLSNFSQHLKTCLATWHRFNSNSLQNQLKVSIDLDKHGLVIIVISFRENFNFISFLQNASVITAVLIVTRLHPPILWL